MKRIVTILFLICSVTYSLNGQNATIFIKGKIIDSLQKGIAYAGVQDILSNIGVSADENGNYSLKIGFPAILKISAIGYVTKEQKIDINPVTDTLEINFVLKTSPVKLTSVEISSENSPIEIASAINLSDFELKGNSILLLYNLTRNSGKIEIVDSGMRPVDHFDINYAASDLKKSNHGYVYTISKDSVYFFDNNNGNWMTFGMSLLEFNKQIKTLIGYENGNYYYELKDSAQAKLAFCYYDRNLKSRKIFYTYVNGEKYNANIETKYQIMVLQDQIEIKHNKSELDNKQIDVDPRSDYSKINALNTTIQPVLCLFRIIRDSIYIFNFDDDSISVFDCNHILKRTIPLPFDKFGNRIRKKDIVVDENNQDCYFKYEVNGVLYLNRINLNNGQVISSIHFTDFPFIEKVRISNRICYFCYWMKSESRPGERKIYSYKLE
ncbi:hypothetical protein BH09BAC5_BH09BAC5_07490 [soil metagenome]